MTDENKSLYEIVGNNKPSAGREREPAPLGLLSSFAFVNENSGDGISAGARSSAQRAWAESDGTFWGTPHSHERLPAGFYRMAAVPNIGPAFLRQKNDTDAIIELPDSESAKVVEEIRVFKTLRPKFQEHGFLYKRGILLWGPPGSGKTSTLQLIVKLLMEGHDSIAALIDNPAVATECLQALRRIEPERQVVAILEDLDALCQRFDESAFLALLDGESQINNVIYIATTNYPERLDKRFVDRPSRFDTVRYIGMPSAAARRVFLRAKLPGAADDQIDEYVRLSDGYSIAHLREFIILTQCFEVSLPDAATRLNKARGHAPNSERAPDRPSFGFVP